MHAPSGVAAGGSRANHPSRGAAYFREPDDRCGVNAKALTTCRGHSSVTTTYDRYGHLMPGNEDEVAAPLDAYLEREHTGASRGGRTGFLRLVRLGTLGMKACRWALLDRFRARNRGNPFAGGSPERTDISRFLRTSVD